MDFLLNLQSALGLLAFPLIALLFCRGRRQINLRIWLAAVGLQLILALIFLKVPWFQTLFELMNQGVIVLQDATVAGTSFVFGYLGGGPLPFQEVSPQNTFIIGFRALPLIIVIGSFTALLSYWKILPWIIENLSKLFSKSLKIGGAVALAGAANVFIGMTEAPLFIRNSIKKLSYSELFMVMTLGMSTVAGTVLVLYATFLNQVIPNAVGHIFTASIISIPAAVLISLMIVPQDGQPTSATAELQLDFNGPMDAIAQGGINAMHMMINIIALLISFLALVYLSNALLGMLPEVAGEVLSMERILGWIMAPICWLMGIPWSEATTAGSLMGIKTVLNELLAFIQQSQLPEDALSPRSDLIISYALCGFANFGSLGILIGGLSTMAPERRKEISSLGLLSILSGTLATCMTASVIGLIT
ncbi:MAG: CNT family concentrative nucleoside transporter [Cryomorphaceae bacterium]|jgi:CNT family concentrative nucleoside transporter